MPPTSTTPASTTAPGCILRLRKVTPKKITVKGAGRVTFKAKRKAGKVKVVAKATRATKRRLAKAVFKLDRKTLKRKHAKLRRSFKLARLKPGKHTLKLKLRPQQGKNRTIKITLRAACR
jgi:hypothetical protein